MKLLVFLFFYLFFSFFAVINTQAQLKLKQKIAMVKSADETEFSILLKEEYDKQGNLILREQPKYYCTESYKYDEKNRVTESDIMCGESNSNGITKNNYKDNKVIIIGEFGAYPFYLQEDSLDNKGRRFLSKRWINTLDEDSTYLVEQVFYNNNNKISKKIESTTFFRKENNNWKEDNTNKTEKTYSYTSFDSLEMVVFKDFSTLESIILEKNTYNKKRQLSETIYTYGSGESHKLYSYDKLGKLVLQKMESRKSQKEAWKLDSKTEFVYQNNKLLTEVITSYYNGLFSAKIINQCENELLQTSKEIDKTGKEVEITIYKYLYY